MTQLLISVKNVEEAQTAQYAGADLIDLKEPAAGALGALDVNTVHQIVEAVNGRVLLSTTVGEGHATTEALISDIALYASLGVDVVKIAVSTLFQQANFFAEIMKLTSRGIKVVVVFFVDQALNFELLPQLERSGCYGAMLDTQFKQASLLTAQSIEILNDFVSLCADNKLVSGLAGSISKDHIEVLMNINPNFIGMRGGVCNRHDRTSVLLGEKVAEIKTLLLNYNSIDT